MITCPSCKARQHQPSNFCSTCGASLLSARGEALTAEVAVRAQGDSGVSPASTVTADEQFPPGVILADRYRIVTIIGKGAMGEVYRADDLKLGQPVALKFLPAAFNADASRLELFHQEVRLARQISHPNVCRVYDIGVVDGRHFLSMEYVDGEDLQALLRRIGRLPVDKVKEIAQQLCAGLTAAHDKGVLHRDLKPANILIDERGQVRITDFGLAKLVQEELTEICGTPAYMAPEQLLHGHTTIQSDIYSLGLVLWEALTGDRVFRGTRQEIHRFHEISTDAEPPASLENTDIDLERVIRQCLEKDPTARPPSVRAVSASLPGGDPLSLIVSMGMTPTPEMVAAAGGTTGLPVKAACICLFSALLGLGLVNLLAEHTYLINQINVRDSYALRIEAERLLEELGYPAGQNDDRDYGFAGDDERQPYFWYRRRPTKSSLVVNELHEKGDAVSGMHGRPSLNMPSWGEPGEVGLVLHTSGTLKWFRAIPSGVFSLNKTVSATTNESHTSILERELGWRHIADLPNERGRIESVLPSAVIDFDLVIPVPPDPFDKLSLWKSSEPDVRLLLVSERQGQLSYLEELSNTSTENRMLLSCWNVFLLFITLLSGGLFLWNYHLGRVDKRTTLHGATYIFVLSMIVWFISAHHVGWTREYEVLRIGLAHALLAAGFFAMWYVAVEPLVRKTWPKCLVTWTRLAKGRFSDPLVGRDLLIGVIAGNTCALYFQLAIFVPGQLGWTSTSWACWWWIPLNGTLDTVSEILRWQVSASFLCLCLLALLVFLRVVFRSELFAMFAVVIFLCIVLFDRESWVTTLVQHTLTWTTLLFLVLRFGLLAFVVGWYTLMLLQHFPLTVDSEHFYFGSGLLATTAVTALALYGFYITIGGRAGLKRLRV